MATITSAQSGNWNQTTTWVGGVVPGDGDNAIIADGHTVTGTANQTIGTAPTPRSDAITCNGSGAVVVDTGATLTVKGDITLDEAAFTMNAGSGLTFVVGSGLIYGLVSEVYGQEGANFVANGTAVNRCTVSKTGDGTAQISTYMSGNNGADIASQIATYTDFNDIGDASNQSIRTRRGTLDFDNCVFDGCGTAGNGVSGYFYPDRDVIFDNCTFKNAAGSYDLDLANSDTNAVTGTRSIVGTVFDAGPRLFDNWGDITWKPQYVEAWSHTSQADAGEYVPEWEDTFINTNSDFTAKSPSVKNCFRYVPTQDNAHPFSLTAESLTAITFDGNIFEHGTDWVTNEGDGILNAASMGALLTVTVQNNLVLPNNSDRASFTLFTDNCTYSNIEWTVNKNTFFSDDRGGGQVAAHGTGSAGRITSFRSNLGWCEASPTDASLLWETGDATPVANYVTVADYNGYNYINTKYDVTAGAIAGTPGANDVNADPQFYDSDRDLASWSSTVLGNTGTDSELRTDAINAIKAINEPSDPDYHAQALTSNLVAWIKEGFAPQNTDFETSGHDGGRIGAVDVMEIPMADPTQVACTADVWTAVATNVTVGTIWFSDQRPKYLITYRMTGEAAPSAGSAEGSVTAPAIEPNRSTPRFTMNYAAAVDVYVKPLGRAGSVRVDV